jgi:hypothetical protein
MRHKSTLTILLFAILLTQALPHAGELMSSKAKKEIKVNHAELIDNTSKLCGVSKESLEMLFNKSPKMFDKIEKYLLGAKLLDQLCHGKGEEALWTVLGQIQDKALDAVMQQICPSNLVAFIKAVKLYKAALELIRDFVFIPALDNTIYERYKNARGGLFDFSKANPDEAFSQATASGKYFPLKQKMYDDLVKAKDYQKKHIGNKLESKLWRDIDKFWIKKLEARYMHELVKKKRNQIELAMHKRILRDIDRIREAAKANAVSLGKDLFPNARMDLPDGLLFKEGRGRDTSIPSKDQKMNPHDLPTWRQNYLLHTGNEKAPDELSINIMMQPRYTQQEVFNPKTQKMENARVGKEEQFGFIVDAMPNCRFIGKNKKAYIMTMADDNIYIHFVHNTVYCQVNVMTRIKSKTPGVTFDNAKVANFIARVIANKINTAANPE